MSIGHLKYGQRIISTPAGTALGCSYRWPTGQYCALHTDRGMVGCGLYDCGVASRFGMAVAIARGTPDKPLIEPEDLLAAAIAEATPEAQSLGIRIGMSGLEALGCLLSSPS